MVRCFRSSVPNRNRRNRMKKLKSLKTIGLISALGALIAISGCDGNAPSPTSTPATGCSIIKRVKTRNSDTKIDNLTYFTDNKIDNMTSTNGFDYHISNDKPATKMQVFRQSDNRLIEEHVISYRPDGKPDEIMIYNNSALGLVDAKKRVFSYVTNVVSGISITQLSKVESFTKTTTPTFVSNGYTTYNYTSNSTRFNEVKFYDGMGNQFLTAQFTGWDGKKNPYFGSIGHLFINDGYFSDFDYWMAQNPTSFTISSGGGSPSTATITYNQYNVNDYPTDYTINDGNITNHQLTYTCY